MADGACGRRTVHALSLVLVGALASGAWSCGPPPVPLFDRSGDAGSGDSYSDELSLWTRRGEVYSQFESRIFAYGTFLSWSFRESMLLHRERTERLPAADVQALRARELGEWERAHVFFLAVHTHEWAWNHLERTDSEALWTLRLLNDKGESAVPLEVRRLGVRNGRYTPLYPYYEDFYVAYLVTFPRQAAAEKDILRQGIARFVLRISGPQAALDLVWEVRQ